MDSLIRNAQFLRQLIIRQKTDVFRHLDAHLPILSPMAVFLHSFCKHVTSFASQIAEYIHKLRVRQAQEGSLIQVLVMMKEKEEKEVKEWEVRAEILMRANSEDAESHRLPGLFQSLDQTLAYYSRLVENLKQLDKSSNQIDTDLISESGNDTSQRYETPTKKDRNIDLYASLYDQQQKQSSHIKSVPSTSERSVGKIRPNKQNLKNGVSEFTPYLSINPRYNDLQSSHTERDQSIRRKLEDEMRRDLNLGSMARPSGKNTSAKAIVSKRTRFKYLQEDGIEEQEQGPLDCPVKPANTHVFSCYENLKEREQAILNKCEQQSGSREKRIQVNQTKQLQANKGRKLFPNKCSGNSPDLLLQFERNWTTEQDSLESLTGQRHVRDPLGQQLEINVDESSTSYDLEKMLAQSLLSSKRWVEGECSEKRNESDDPASQVDSLEEFNIQKTAKFQANDSEEEEPRQLFMQPILIEQGEDVHGFSFGTHTQ